MDKKKIIYLIGGVAIIGLGYYLWNKSRAEKDDSKRLASDTTPTDNASDSTKKDESKADLSKKEQRKEDKKDSKEFKLDCGKRPVLKKNRDEWEKCIARMKSTSSSGFNGYVMHTNHSDIAGLTDIDF